MCWALPSPGPSPANQHGRPRLLSPPCNDPHLVSRSRQLLSLGVVPCRGLRPDEWRETHGRLCAFIDQWGVQAHEAGWDTLRLIGIHPELGTIRCDFCGILVTLSVDIHEVTPEWIKLGR
ncbi:hypothetical protein SAMN04487843_11529 [Methylobacterium sp. ap11]|uniref:hypothetical protein n=1 Tax=Methylobacterium sp. ap11 TaxID=1761799 RepID=UPI0008C88D73|nr:hypothetical protein [Methylobacterium sp. ap11]SEP39605.1 hypothetical protein SAMN04487843_11529 [Methylobacterium sp. ap11]